MHQLSVFDLQNNKTVSFQDNMSRNQSVHNMSIGGHHTSEIEDKEPLVQNKTNMTVQYHAKDSQVSLSPFERSMANYKATRQQLVEGEFKRINERKQELLKMKKERELRNSGINSTLEGNRNFHNLVKVDAESVILEDDGSVEKKLNASKSPDKTLNHDIRDNDDCKFLLYFIKP